MPSAKMSHLLEPVSRTSLGEETHKGRGLVERARWYSSNFGPRWNILSDDGSSSDDSVSPYVNPWHESSVRPNDDTFVKRYSSSHDRGWMDSDVVRD